MEIKGIRIIYYNYLIWALVCILSIRTTNILLKILSVLIGILIVIAINYYKKNWILIDAKVIKERYFLAVYYYHYHYKIKYLVDGKEYIGTAFDNQGSMKSVKIKVLKNKPQFYMDKMDYSWFGQIVIILYIIFVIWKAINNIINI